MKKLFFLLMALMLSGCVAQSTQKQFDQHESKSKAELTLINLGYTDIKMTGTAWIGCSQDDSLFTSKTFEARNNGKEISGSVCCGLILKGCTVRY